MVSFCSRFPFGTNNLIGYLIAVILQYFIIDYISLLATILLSTLVQSYYNAMAVTSDIKNDLKWMNKFAKIKKNRLQRMRQKICNFIEFHSAAKQFRNFVKIIFWIVVLILTKCSFHCNKCCVFRFNNEVTEFTQPLFLVFFVMCLASICSSMLIIQVDLVECDHELFIYLVIQI